MKLPRRTLVLLLAPLVAVPVAVLAASADEAWSEHCARCHGADGTANTKIGKKLKLRDYSSAAVQAKMSDEEIEKAIRDGVFDENKKERMPAYSAKLNDKEIKDLVTHVRSLKK